MARGSWVRNLAVATGLLLVTAAPVQASHSGVVAGLLIQHNGRQIAEYGATGSCPPTDLTHCGVVVTMSSRDANRFKRWCPNGDRTIDLTIAAGTGATPFLCQGPSGWSVSGSVRLDPLGVTHSEAVEVHVVVSR